jgi:hypothetical protein
MAARLVESNFGFGFPVWLAVDKELHEKRGLPDSLMCIEEETAGPCLPFFTDEFLAQDFAEQDPGLGYTKIETSGSFDAILAQAEQKGINHVAIDVGKERARFYPIKDLRAAIRGGQA